MTPAAHNHTVPGTCTKGACPAYTAPPAERRTTFASLAHSIHQAAKLEGAFTPVYGPWTINFVANHAEFALNRGLLQIAGPYLALARELEIELALSDVWGLVYAEFLDLVDRAVTEMHCGECGVAATVRCKSPSMSKASDLDRNFVHAVRSVALLAMEREHQVLVMM